MGKLISCLVLFYFISCSVAQDYGGFRVNTTAVPSKYSVHFTFAEDVFNGSDKTYSGSVEITFQVTESTTEIQLNSGLDLSSTIYRLIDGNTSYSLEESQLSYNSTNFLLKITSPVGLVANKDYLLRANIVSNNISTREPRGIFRSKVTDFTINETDYIVAANFRGVLSRLAFPSFDEPLLKATFVLSITAPSGLLIVGPTPANSTSKSNGLQTVMFQETPKISTFALGFVVGNIECNSTNTSGVSIRICSKFNDKNQRSFPLNLAPQIIESLSNLTGLHYNKYATKLDIVALPSSFVTRVVSSYGLVLLPDYQVLVNQNTNEATLSSVIQNGVNLSYAIARQWFSILVTPEWWDYNYLAQGLSIIFGYRALYKHEAAVDWHTDTRFYTHIIAEAFELDSNNHTLPLTSKADTLEEVEAKFSRHVAAKAASILYMARNIVGSENFLKGVSFLLNNYAFGGGPDLALWEVLANYTPATNLPKNVSLATVMSTWTDQPGYPILNQYTVNLHDVKLSTQRYTYSGWYDQPVWYLPLFYTLANDTSEIKNTTPKMWLAPNESYIWVNLTQDSEWELFNNQWAGFFRGVPDQLDILPHIGAVLKANATGLEVNTRAQLVSDYLNFARGGQLWYRSVLNFTEYMVNETKYNPWYVYLKDIAFPLKRFGPGSFAYDALIKYNRRILANRWEDFKNLNASSTNALFNQLQEIIVAYQCLVGRNTECVSQAKRLFLQIDHIEPANLRTVIKKTALAFSDEPDKTFDIVWGRMLNATNALRRHNELSVLGYVRNETVINKLLNYTLDDQYNIRGEDFRLVWNTVASNQISGTETALNFLTNNYERVAEAYGRTDLLIRNIADFVYREEQVDLINSLISNANLSPRDSMAANAAAQSALENIAWAALNSDDVYYYVNPPQ